MTTRIVQLPEMEAEDRLKIYNLLLNACTHLYSKNKFQEEKFKNITETFVKLAKEDPIFMAHFTAWAAKQDSKDLKVLAIFFNALNDADGLPFFKGSNKNKPNFRYVSAALLQQMSPHLALRILELTRYKFGISNTLSDGAHYPSFLKNAFRKYILYREANPDMIRGIKNSGLGKKYIKMYKMLHMAPTLETASILGWKQKNRDIKLEKIDFTGKSATEITNEIKSRKISALVALSALPENSMNAKIAKALLQNATGNQAIILQNMFRRKGFLEIQDIRELFDTKITSAGTAVDRIDTLSKNLTDEEKSVMSKTRSRVRKEIVGDIGKMFMHIDISGSMQGAIKFAKEKASIVAECVKDPKTSFAWGLFGTNGKVIPNPEAFTKEDFHAALYGVLANAGSTDCLALYPQARKFGADVDVYVTDQEHNVGVLDSKLKTYITRYGKPNSVIIVTFGRNHSLRDAFDREGVPTAEITPEALIESALVAQAVKNAIRGKLAIVDEILDTPLPLLPRWYSDKSLNSDYLTRLAI